MATTALRLAMTLAPKRKLWIAAFCAAAITTAIGTVHQGYPPTPRFYVALPGLAAGLVTGWAIDSPLVVFPLMVTVNALAYYGILRLILRFSQHRPR
jgi:hypothetical protein